MVGVEEVFGGILYSRSYDAAGMEHISKLFRDEQIFLPFVN